MKLIKEISTDQMIGEFLKAELHSSRFREGSLKALRMLGYSESLVENPDYGDTAQNQNRAKVLSLCRGWPDTNLFTHFPRQVKWFDAKVPLAELKKAYRLKSHVNMTDVERSLAVTASRVMKNMKVENIENQLIHEIRDKIERQQSLPPIILVGKSLVGGKRVLIEGHSRSVAYSSFEQLEFDIPAIIGISEEITSWDYF